MRCLGPAPQAPTRSAPRADGAKIGALHDAAMTVLDAAAPRQRQAAVVSLLLAQSGHRTKLAELSASDPKRTSAGRFDRMRGAHLKIVLDLKVVLGQGKSHAELKRSR